jgi:hypothetical protein
LKCSRSGVEFALPGQSFAFRLHTVSHVKAATPLGEPDAAQV